METTVTVISAWAFRRFEILNPVFMLNGQRLIFRGVNRHEFSPRPGLHNVNGGHGVGRAPVQAALNITRFAQSATPNDTVSRPVR